MWRYLADSNSVTARRVSAPRVMIMPITRSRSAQKIRSAGRDLGQNQLLNGIWADLRHIQFQGELQ